MISRTPAYIYVAGLLCGTLTAFLLMTLFPILGTGQGMAGMLLCGLLSLPYTIAFAALRRRLVEDPAARKQDQSE